MRNTLVASVCLVLPACFPADDHAPSSGEVAQETTVANGVSLNGVSLNGVSLNGVSLNGVSLNGVSLNGVSLNGVSLNGVSLSGSTLTGTSADTDAPTTGSVVGTTVVGTLSNGASLIMRFDSAAPLAAPNADLWSYGVSYASDGGWQPLCGAGVGVLAVPGTWDTRAGVVGGGSYTASTTAFTFACRGMTIAKCVEMGYKPSLGRTNELLSCVRLLRGDYCGNGTPYTVTGNQVNIYDNIGAQRDTEGWTVEAEWTPAGARCVAAKRDTRAYVSGLVPPCIANMSLALPVCGVFRNGAVLIDEIPTTMLGPTATSTTTGPTKSTTTTMNAAAAK